MNDDKPEGQAFPSGYTPQEVKALIAPVLELDPEQPMDIVIGVFWNDDSEKGKVRITSVMEGLEGDDREDICYLLTEENLILKMAAACANSVHRAAHEITGRK